MEHNHEQMSNYFEFYRDEAHLTSADETGSIPVTEKFTQLLDFNWIRLRITNENTHITAYSVH